MTGAETNAAAPATIPPPIYFKPLPRPASAFLGLVVFIRSDTMDSSMCTSCSGEAEGSTATIAVDGSTGTADACARGVDFKLPAADAGG